MSHNTDLNKAHFNKESVIYDTKHEKTLLQLREAMRARRAFIGADWVEEGDSRQGKTVKLLDYACGTGSVSVALAPYITQAVGVDLSPGMVDAYNARARAEGFSADRMNAIQGNILDDAPAAPAALSAQPSLAAGTFDVAAVGLGAHHFDDPTLVARRLVDRLKPGGVLFIIDLLAYTPPPKREGQDDGAHDHGHGHGDGHSHSHGHGHGHGHGHHGEGDEEGASGAIHTVAHHGFTEEQVKELFQTAGAGADYAFEVVPDVDFPYWDGVERTVFFARGAKA